MALIVISITLILLSKKTLSLADRLFVKKEPDVLTKFTVYLIVILLLIPLIINESYKHGGYITLWGADDVLSFYGSFLSFIGTIALGGLAFWQNKKIMDINQEQNEKNDYYQRINAQNLLPTVQIFNVTQNHLHIPPKGAGTPTKLKEQSFEVTYNPFENSSDNSNKPKEHSPVIKLNMDFDPEKSNELVIYSKSIKFKLKNSSQAIINKITFNKIIINKPKIQSNIEPLIFNKKQEYNYNIQGFIQPNNEENVTLTLYFQNKMYNEHWRSVNSNMHINLYITNTTNTGIVYDQLISIIFENDGYKCIYEEWEDTEEQKNGK